ncbi:MAG: OsmC family protein [Alphaproteobacteria bacterium]|nr:OsmC family protein [Alphaproteobacteria bacterium]
MAREHHYETTVTWTGNLGTGTSSYRAYSRAHEIAVEGRPVIPGSSDPAFRGDATRHNPEDMLVASLSACHMLWYLHLCAAAGVVVTRYVDRAEGVMAEEADGAGQFVRVVLRPEIALAPAADETRATALHHEAHAKCFIARSVNFPVECRPRFVRGADAA